MKTLSGPFRAISLGAAAVGLVIVLALANGGTTKVVLSGAALSADQGEAIGNALALAEENACGTCHQAAVSALQAPNTPAHGQQIQMLAMTPQDRAAVTAYLKMQ